MNAEKIDDFSSNLAVAHNPTSTTRPGSTFPSLALWFMVVGGLVLVEQSLPYWREGHWLAGTHADGPFHFYCELLRLQPSAFPNDLAVQSNRSLGAYETTYNIIVRFAQATGWSLITTNLVFCWLGNFLYLSGVMLLLYGLNLTPIWCALGAFIVAQPFELIGMSSGVVHSLAIPREFWLWPLPWLTMWFMLGRREGYNLVLFYAALGIIYCYTYPLWAILFSVAFGLADAWRCYKRRRYDDFAWLAVGGMLCGVFVAIPALTIAKTVAGGESAVLDYNQISRAVYWTKGFRRLVLFAAMGWWALCSLGRQTGGPTEAMRRLAGLLGVTFLVCMIYEPFQRLIPILSLLYLGRLSLVTYLASMLAVALWLHANWPVWQRRVRGLALVGLPLFCFYPIKNILRDRDIVPSCQPDFVKLCLMAKQELQPAELALVPPDLGCHFFRVYAERGLWISPKDTGVLSRTRALYSEARRRLERYEKFYAADTPAGHREQLLQQFRSNGVTYIVTKAGDAWTETISWPVVDSQGTWQLRSAKVRP